MPHRVAALLLAATFANGPALAADRAFDTAVGDFRKFHRQEMRRSGIVGSSFYVVRHGATVVADHLGEHDVEAHVPVEARTI